MQKLRGERLLDFFAKEVYMQHQKYHTSYTALMRLRYTDYIKDTLINRFYNIDLSYQYVSQIIYNNIDQKTRFLCAPRYKCVLQKSCGRI